MSQPSLRPVLRGLSLAVLSALAPLGCVEDLDDSDTAELDERNVAALQLSSSAIYNAFLSDQPKGYCYRSPSIVRSGEFIAVVSQKRRGYDPAAIDPIRRPYRAGESLGEKLVSASACADESSISVVVRIAKVERDPVTRAFLTPNQLKWSPELEIVNIDDFVSKALTPGSDFFEPVLYDYFLRLKSGDFLYKDSGYLACTDEVDCEHLQRCADGTETGSANDAQCQGLLGRNLFEDYLADEYGVNEPGKWLAVDANVRKLITARLGASAATGWVDSLGNEWMTLASVIAYPAAPHASSNNDMMGDTLLKHGGLRVDLRALWQKYAGESPTKSFTLDVTDPALAWRLRFNNQVMSECLDVTETWAATPTGLTATATFDQQLAQAGFESVSLRATSGLNMVIPPPGSAADLLDLVRWSSTLDNPMGAVENLPSKADLSPVLDVMTWMDALEKAYNQEGRYPEILRDPAKKASVLALLTRKTPLTYDELVGVHADMGVPMNKGGNPEIAERRLAAVMSIYARMINARVTVHARQLQHESDLHKTSVGDRLERLFAKDLRFGPGNGIYLPADDKIHLTVVNAFPLTVSPDLQEVDCAHDNTTISSGSERQGAILRRENGAYHLLMDLRSGAVKQSSVVNGVPQPFNLATWTRIWGVSTDAGRTWASGVIPPAHFECGTKAGVDGVSTAVRACSVSGTGANLQVTVTPPSETPIENKAFLIERAAPKGFVSSQVQGSMTSIPGFFGAGKSLILDVHPSTATRALLEGLTQPVTCLGESGGDASKDTKSRCDYRYNLQITPGSPRPSSNYADLKPGVAASAVDWLFTKRAILHPGSAGYSATVHLGREGCSTASVAVAYEGTATKNAYEYRGFNNGINVQFVRASGGDYSYLGDCTKNLDMAIEY